MNELKKELKEINKKLSEVVLSSIGKDQGLQARILWARKRRILAKLNPINL